MSDVTSGPERPLTTHFNAAVQPVEAAIRALRSIFSLKCRSVDYAALRCNSPNGCNYDFDALQ